MEAPLVIKTTHFFIFYVISHGDQFSSIAFVLCLKVSCLNFDFVYIEIMIIFGKVNNVSFCCWWVFHDGNRCFLYLCGCFSNLNNV